MKRLWLKAGAMAKQTSSRCMSIIVLILDANNCNQQLVLNLSSSTITLTQVAAKGAPFLQVSFFLAHDGGGFVEASTSSSAPSAICATTCGYKKTEAKKSSNTLPRIPAFLRTSVLWADNRAANAM